MYKAERLFDLHLLDNDLHFLDSHLCVSALEYNLKRQGMVPQMFTNEHYLKPRLKPGGSLILCAR